MLKRLLIAVFVLGLLVAFTGTAFSSNQGDQTLRVPATTGKLVKASASSDRLDYRPPTNHRVVTRHSVSDFGTAEPFGSDTAGCELQDWTQYATTAGYYAWTLGGGITDQMAMRYDITPFHAVNVTGSKVRVYGVWGTPQLVLSVWSDAAGQPGALLHTESFTPTVGNNVYTFTTPVNITNGGPYHISMGGTGTVADSFQVSSDDGAVGTGRGSYEIAGVWYPNTAINFGPGSPYDFNWRCPSEVCQYYVNCGTIMPGGSYYRDGLPDNAWSDGSVLSGTGQRFKAEGPETLKSITFVHRVVNSANYTNTSTNSLIVKIWGDSAGYARLTPGPILTTTVPAGIANLFPVTGNIPTPGLVENLNIPIPGMPVMLGIYHVTVEMSSLNPADGTLQFRFGAGDSEFGGGMVKFTPPGSGREWDNIANNAIMNSDFYGDLTTSLVVPCDIHANTCKSEFTDCKYGTATSCGSLTRIQQAAMTAPAGCTISVYDAWAQRIKGNPVNMIDKIRVGVRANYVSGACVPDSFAILNVNVWSSIGGAPGPLIASYPVTTGIKSYPGWNEVVIPGGLRVLGDFFIGYDILSFTGTQFMWAGFQRNGDAGVCPPIRDGAWVHRKPTAPTDPNVWWNRLAMVGTEDNLVAEVDFCAIPLGERVCTSESDWPTYQHDMGRTGASFVSLGSDAYCDLTMDWSRIRPTSRSINLNGPIIWNNHVILAFSASTAGSYEVFNLQTGGDEYHFTNAAWGGDGSIIGGNIRCTPTVATVTVAGVPTPVLFLSGGNPGSISAFNLKDNFTIAPTLLWSANMNNGWLGHTAGMGATRYGNIIFLKVGTDECVFWAADDNLVYAAHAATGLPYAPFNGGNLVYTPFNLGQSSQKSGCTDGTFLFYSTFNAGGNGGHVIAINPANGTQVWNFTATQGPILFPTSTLETFESGVSTDGGEVYAISRIFNGSTSGVNYRRGVFYRLNATTGAMLSATVGDRGRNTTPTIDAARVYVPTLPAYLPPEPLGGSLLAFSRSDGSLSYATTSFLSGMGGGQVGYWVESALSCEPDSSDLLYAFNMAGYLSCFKADKGTEMYSRRVDWGIGTNNGGMLAIGRDALGKAHLVATDLNGGVYDFSKGAPRARLELLAGNGTVAVPFQSPADTVVTFPKMYTNTGCTPLMVSLTASTTSNGTNPPVSMRSIGSRLDQSSSTLADMLSGNGFNVYTTETGMKVVGMDKASGDVATDVNLNSARTTYNHSAAAIPAFLNQNLGSYAGDVFSPANGNITTNPGDTAGISVHANGPLVNRGPNSFYCEFTTTNDPDYYLDVPTRKPELFLNLVGGCLIDTTSLHFGAASANLQLVTNTSRLATGDWSSGPSGTHGFTINGHIEVAYQMFMAYAVSEHRQALNSQAWQGGGEVQSWWSTQGDPNWCDGKCKPELTTGVSMGDYSSDGITYTTLSGNVVCRSYIDSVQNMDLGGGWDWSNYGAPFDNDSTMGIYVRSKVYGVVGATGGAALLNNLTLDVQTITNRNATPIPAVRAWVYDDNDLGSKDTAFRDANYSVGWAADNTGAGIVCGFIKVPFGPGYTPLKNVTACAQNTISFLPDWDTAWKYTDKPAGLYVNDQTGASDYGCLYGLDEHAYGPNETYKVGFAFFSYLGEANTKSSAGNIANTALLVNKWAGFGRGDVNNDGVVNLSDIIYLADHVNFGKPGPIPFKHLGDVNNSGGAPDLADVTYMVDYYFNYGPAPVGAFVLGN